MGGSDHVGAGGGRLRDGDPGLEAGGRTLFRLAREMTSRNNEANWNPGTRNNQHNGPNMARDRVSVRE